MKKKPTTGVFSARVSKELLSNLNDLASTLNLSKAEILQESYKYLSSRYNNQIRFKELQDLLTSVVVQAKEVDNTRLSPNFGNDYFLAAQKAQFIEMDGTFTDSEIAEFEQQVGMIIMELRDSQEGQ